jgi:uncharacterized protein (DUF433 family)
MPKLRFDAARLLGYSDPLETPTYTIAEAAHYLKMPSMTLRDWLLGCQYRVKQGTERRRSRPLIELADKQAKLLSFNNLAEAHVLSAFRRTHRVQLENIRQALDFVTRKYLWPHPLLQQEFATDGVGMFVEHLGQLVDASSGQMGFRSVLQSHLRRLERSPSGAALRLYPFTRPDCPDDNPRSVFIDPRYAFGRPVLAAAKVPTESLVERYLAGEAIEALARDYDCETLDVQEAIRAEWVAAA